MRPVDRMKLGREKDSKKKQDQLVVVLVVVAAIMVVAKSVAGRSGSSRLVDFLSLKILSWEMTRSDRKDYPVDTDSFNAYRKPMRWIYISIQQ